MRYLIALLGFLCISTFAIAQTPLTWLTPMPVNATIGTDWPRVAVAKSAVVISWGDFSSGTVLFRRYLSGSFGPEKQLSPAGFSASAFGLTGPDLKASGDTVYVAYSASDGLHAFLQHSYDGGNSFSDTIQIDNIGYHYPQYPTLDIMPGGNPIISFAQLDFGIPNPQYVVTKSFDGGNTFTPAIGATETLGEDPCDCCPGTMVYDDSVVCVIYRNAINNVRDMRAAISLDNGNTFNYVGTIDNSGWIFNSCPSIGGDGVIEGDTLISVFMNGLDGNKCYVSTLNVHTLQLGFKKQLFNLPGNGNQTHPRLVAKGDTMAAVWEQVIGSHRYIMFSYSLSGAAGLGETVDTISNVIADGFHSNPDIAYSYGKFYVVFSDAVAHEIYLMEGILYGTTGIETASLEVPSVQLVSDFEGDEITILSTKTINESCFISIYNTSGTLCKRHEMHSLQHSQVVTLNEKLKSGLYLVTISSDKFLATGKFVIAH